SARVPRLATQDSLHCQDRAVTDDTRIKVSAPANPLSRQPADSPRPEAAPAGERMKTTASPIARARYTFPMALCLYVATTSQGKLREFRAAAQAHTVRIEPLPQQDKISPPEENGQTFSANATLKSVYYSRFAPGELVLADDSGLEVDALNGAPGVRSA